MIEIVRAKKIFNRFKGNKITAISDTTLTLPDQGLVALLGPSGCGKTTMLNAIGGLDNLTSGNIYINGQKVSSKLAYKKDKIRNLHVGYIFQDYKLVDDLSVFDNVAIALKLIGIKDQKEIKERVEYVLDKVGLYRFRNRKANMLSGGQRQRVGIARALVKEPDIILADEPTGNLDSRNSVEIMNIIQAISKKCLVILVTHEQTLARYYASQIIEIVDGKVINNYENHIDGSLDYQIANEIYLGDMECHQQLDDIHIYSSKHEAVKLDIVFRNGNIYIQNRSNEKIEVVDSNSAIKFVEGKYEGITKEEVNFGYHQSIQRKRYASIISLYQSIKDGYKKIFSYSILKKILFIGYIITGMFVMYSFASIVATLNVDENNYVNTSKDVIQINGKPLSQEEVENYVYQDGDYLLVPGSLKVNMFIKPTYLVQNVNPSIRYTSIIQPVESYKGDIYLGNMPVDNNEVAIDLFIINKLTKSDEKMHGLTHPEDFIGKKVYFADLKECTIVGITNNNHPVVYMNKANIIPIVYLNTIYPHNYIETYDSYDNRMLNITGFYPYSLIQDQIKIVQGRAPQNDLEVVVPNYKKESYPLNKACDIMLDNKKMVVVGYYESYLNSNYNIVSDHAIYTDLYLKADGFNMVTNNKQATIQMFREKGTNAVDAFEQSKVQYYEEQEDFMRNSLLLSGIILGISLIEMYLMMRSSFLSRIKEVGIYRAIGTKKSDIYKMFAGEVIALTTITSFIGILAMAYILYELAKEITYVQCMFIITPPVILAAIVFIFIFNIIIGLLPVFMTMRHTPASILSRSDVQ